MAWVAFSHVLVWCIGSFNTFLFIQWRFANCPEEVLWFLARNIKQCGAEMIINSWLHFKLLLFALVNVRTVMLSLQLHIPCPNGSFFWFFVCFFFYLFLSKDDYQISCAVKLCSFTLSFLNHHIGSFFLLLLQITKSIQSRFNLFTFRALVCAAQPPPSSLLCGKPVGCSPKNEETWQTSMATFDFWTAALSARPRSSSLLWVRDGHWVGGTTRVWCAQCCVESCTPPDPKNLFPQ